MEGSGYFLVNSSEQDIVTITYMEAESSVQVSSRDRSQVDSLRSKLILTKMGKNAIVCLELVIKVTFASFFLTYMYSPT